MQAIDRIGGETDRSVETETAGRAVDVVVDRLRDPDERNPLLVELVRDRERAVTTDADQRIEPHLLEHFHDAVGVVERALWRDDRLGKRIAAVDGAEDGAAEAQDTGHVLRRELARSLRIDQSIEAVLETKTFDAGVTGRFDDGANDGVEARSVAATSQNADT